MPTRHNRPKVFHPFLFAIFPVVFLYSHNIGEVILSRTLAPLAVCLAGGILLWCIIFAVLRNKIKSAILTSLILIYFFSYGHAFGFVKGIYVGSWKIGIHTYFLPVWTSVFFVLIFIVFRAKKTFYNLTKIMNLMAVCLVVMSIANIGIVQSQILRHSQSGDASNLTADSDSIEPGKIIAKPDIYYIILDAHLRADMIEQFFGYDSSPFISRLKGNGFFVPDKSRSNYVQTLMSIPSLLNFKYVNEVANADLNTTAEKKLYMRNMFVNNRAFKFLREQGYSLVSFSTSCPLTKMEDADVILSGVYTSDAFLNELMNCTLFIALENLSVNQKYVHYRKVKYILDFLPETAKYESPHIVFAHIMCPHPPFVFDADGNFTSSGDTFEWKDKNPNIPQRKAKYLAQVKYIDKKIAEAIEGILANSKEQPIIIVQGDHGVRWGIGQRAPFINYSILNALHLPGYDYSKLDNEITSVNTFRFILNHYFGTDLEILENKTYFSGPPAHTEFKEVRYDMEIQP